jgi:hypothetical protein
MADSPRIILWDIETSHNIVAVFQLQNQDWIQPENILQERHIICAAWKLLNENKIESVSLLDDPKLYKEDPHDDFFVCKKLHDVLMNADAIVHHNGNKFDIKYVETRMLMHGLSPLPPIPMIDTYQVAKTRFLFNSNKLDYLGHLLEVGRKKPTTNGLWLRVLQGDKSAIREMVAYNKQDVALLERVFLKLQPYIANHLNRQLFGKSGCPRCGSLKVQSRGVHRAVTRVYNRFQCQKCGGWFRSLKNIENTTTPTRVL